MPSPIAHLAAGYVVYRLSRSHEPQPALKPVGPLPGLLLAAAAFSLLPDMDSIVGWLMGDFGRFHNNLTHSLLVGLGVSLGFAGFMKWRQQEFRFWFIFALICYTLHVLMDAATVGRGVMAFWPITDQRFLLPALLFYGLHWSDGWLSSRHLWTAVTELAFAALVIILTTQRRIGNREVSV